MTYMVVIEKIRKNLVPMLTCSALGILVVFILASFDLTAVVCNVVKGRYVIGK